jgi:hypothetical protein
MPNRNAIVSKGIRFDPQLDRAPAEMLEGEGGLSVVFDGERRAVLDAKDPRSVGFVEILDSLRELHRPVYLEIDPATSAITRLAIPLVGHVVDLRPDESGVLQVGLDTSHAVHRLSLGGPEAVELQRRLRDALDTRRPIILVDDDAHEILEIREFVPGPDDEPLPPFPEKPEFWRVPLIWSWLHVIWWWPYWPWWWVYAVSMNRAQGFFDAMQATNCEPLTASAPCIPFMYPDNGCWARANEMCRLMAAMGETSRKVWITRSPAKPLHGVTRNHPQCFIEWRWHVAPTILVRSSWFFPLRRMVVDPSLATGPLTKDDWRLVMQDSTASLVDSDASQYQYYDGTDPTFSQTNTDLQVFRLALKARSLLIGPPPYAACP